LNESLANLIVARLKTDGRLPADELGMRLGATNLDDVRGALDALVKRGDIQMSPRGQYYVPGSVTSPAPPRERGKRKKKTTALVKFRTCAEAGTGVEIDGRLVLPGDTLTNEQLNDIFGVANMGGIRISKLTGTILLVSSVDNDLYEDRDQDGFFSYTGEGQRGDQELVRGNKALYDSPGTGAPLLLFYKKQANEYEFQGEVRLAAVPTQEQQPDADGQSRAVWVFPLAPVDL
jgi:hypothetical protein